MVLIEGGSSKCLPGIYPDVAVGMTQGCSWEHLHSPSYGIRQNASMLGLALVRSEELEDACQPHWSKDIKGSHNRPPSGPPLNGILT